MKKFLSFFVITIIIVISCSFSASASNFSVPTKGTYQVFEDVLTGEQVNTLESNRVYKVYSPSMPTSGVKIRYTYSTGSGSSAYSNVPDSSLNTPYVFTPDTWSTVVAFGAMSSNCTAFYFKIEVPCDGSTCPAADVNRDGVCDDCGSPLVFNLRGDTILLNNSSFARYIKLKDGSIVDFYTHFDNIAVTSNLIIVSESGEFDSATLYQVYPNVEVLNGYVTTVASTDLAVYTSEFDENGAPYWQYSANVNWGSGNRIDAFNSIWWTAKDIPAGDGISQSIDGDPNFTLPLWKTIVLGVAQGVMIIQQKTIIQTMALLTACGVGLMALLISLILLRKKLFLFLVK